MQLTEHKVKHGEVLIDQNEKILSFGIDKGYIYFWGCKKSEKSVLAPSKYVVLDKTDKIEDNYHHVATLVEGVEPKHIFMYVEPPTQQLSPRKVTKVITESGTETLEAPAND